MNFIFTFNYAINYGAFLQTFALLNFNKNNCVADLTPKSLAELKYCVSPRIRKKMPLIWLFFAVYRFVKKYIYIRRYRFAEFKMLRITPNFSNWESDAAKKYLDGNTAIVGSDQIWNPRMIEGRERLFFADIANYSKRIAYAPSLGMRAWPKQFEKKVINYLMKFDAVSVREESAAKYLKSIGFSDVAWVCDPTILHTPDFYLKNFRTNRIIQHKFIFHYVIRERIPKSFFTFENLETIWINAGNRKNIVNVSDWLFYINKSEYVITDSFHCVVFCLLFHKIFVVIKNKSRGEGMNERFSSLLGRTKLMYRCIESDEPIESVKERLFRYVDWDCVDSIIDEWRQYSLNWLKSALDS